MLYFSADKYCGLVKVEGGLKLLKDLLTHPAPYEMIKDLACIVISNCAKFKYAIHDGPDPPTSSSPDN